MILSNATTSLALPFVFLMLTQEKGCLVTGLIFGTSNRLMAVPGIRQAPGVHEA